MKFKFPHFSRVFLTFVLVGLTCACSLSQSQVTAPLSSQRQEQVEAYLNEFSAGEFRGYYTNIYQALTNALNKLPDDVFQDVTDRKSPVVFINTITTGIARYANSKEFRFIGDEPPAFQEGFYLMVLGDELNDSNNIPAIEGIILHELAHDYLKHLRAPKHNCEMEREANRLVKAWGYTKEYEAASKEFGAKKPGDSPCKDYFEKQEEELKKKNAL
ncbi:MAG: hypothetical protein KBD53_11220 [Candidatus Omnitrophica bacterium]|nr:hypothetical protein [Candidatus Omnitrophota bacterium]